jgi:hypothetical protein
MNRTLEETIRIHEADHLRFQEISVDAITSFVRQPSDSASSTRPTLSQEWRRRRWRAIARRLHDPLPLHWRGIS